MTPAVSVIIPAYNAGVYIEQAIASVLDQTFTDFELIVVDDGSTDDTGRRVEQLGNRVRYIRQANQGRSVARNQGILAAHGRFVAFLDADDLWRPQKLAMQMDLLERQPEIGLVFSWAQAFYADRRSPYLLGQDFADTAGHAVFSGLLQGKSLPTLTVVADRAAVIRAGLFDPSIAIGEDWDLWLRLTLHCNVAVVPAVLADYRLGGKFLPAAMAHTRMPDCRVRSVKRVFREIAADPSLVELAKLEQQALALAWWRGCLVDYAVGDFISGQRRLTCSLRLDPAFHWNDQHRWLEELIAFAITLRDDNTPRAEAEQFLRSFFAHLPPAGEKLRKRQRAAISHLLAGYGFRLANEQGQAAAAGAVMRQALRTNPQLLRNLGAVSIALRGTWIDKGRLAWRPADVHEG